MATDSGILERAGRQRSLRWGTISGVAFAIFSAAGIFALGANGPDITNGAPAATSFYADSGHRTTAMVGLYLFTLAALCLIGFLVSLVTHLRQATAEHDPLPSVALITGVLFAAILLLFAGIAASPAATIILGRTAIPNPDVTGMLAETADTLILIPGLFAASALLITTGVVALRTGALPRWLAWFGFVVALIEIIVGWIFIPMFLISIWALLTSIALLRRAPARQAHGLEQLEPTDQRSSLGRA